MSPKPIIYRICSFDAALNIVSAELVKAADDQDAIAKAQASGSGSKCEIWDGDRLVAELGTRSTALIGLSGVGQFAIGEGAPGFAIESARS